MNNDPAKTVARTELLKQSILPKINCNIPMPNVRQPIGSGDRICSTCQKEDVCMYNGVSYTKEAFENAKGIQFNCRSVSIFNSNKELTDWVYMRNDEYYGGAGSGCHNDI